MEEPDLATFAKNSAKYVAVLRTFFGEVNPMIKSVTERINHMTGIMAFLVKVRKNEEN